jgi:hypothetical protein
VEAEQDEVVAEDSRAGGSKGSDGALAGAGVAEADIAATVENDAAGVEQQGMVAWSEGGVGDAEKVFHLPLGPKEEIAATRGQVQPALFIMGGVEPAWRVAMRQVSPGIGGRNQGPGSTASVMCSSAPAGSPSAGRRNGA